MNSGPDGDNSQKSRSSEAFAAPADTTANQSLFTRIVNTVSSWIFPLQTPEWVMHYKKNYPERPILYLAVREGRLDMIDWILKNGSQKERDVNARGDLQKMSFTQAITACNIRNPQSLRGNLVKLKQRLRCVFYASATCELNFRNIQLLGNS
jgi:hypothetical protein